VLVGDGPDLHRLRSFGCLVCPVSRHLPFLSEYCRRISGFRVASASVAPYIFRDPVFVQDESSGIVLANRVPINTSELVWSVFFKDCKDPGSKVAHHCSHRLSVVLTVMDHLTILDRSKLRIGPVAYVSCLI
jgi:hypothetical protein